MLALFTASCSSCRKRLFPQQVPDAAVDETPDTGAPAPTADLDAAPEAEAPAVSATATATAKAAFAQGETWAGSYVCAQGSTALQLRISHSSPNVAAVFSFEKGKTVGSFSMSGTYDAGSRHLHLVAGSWIVHPGNFVTVNLDGHLSADGHTFAGSVQGPGCTSFSVSHR